MISRLIQSLQELTRLDPSRNSLLEMADSSATNLAELTRDLVAYRDQIEFNPRRLEEVEERLALLQSLKRKYGGDISAILEYLGKAKMELDGITHAEERVDELEQLSEKLMTLTGRSKSGAHGTQKNRCRDALPIHREGIG